MRKELKEQLEAVQKEQAEKEAIESAPFVATDVALGMARDPQTQQWFVIRIPYNFSTGRVGTLEKTQQEDRLLAEERFRIAATNDVFLKESV